jgi:hypothetical protein
MILLITSGIFLVSCKNDDNQEATVNITEPTKLNEKNNNKEENNNNKEKNKELEESNKTNKKDIDSAKQPVKLSNENLIYTRNQCLFVINTETKECIKAFDKTIQSDIKLSRLKKKNYFISEGSLYLLDGESLKVSFIKEMNKQMNYITYNIVNDFIIFSNGNKIYMYDIKKDNEKELINNKELFYIADINPVTYNDDVVYMITHNIERESDVSYYKYSFKTNEIEEVYIRSDEDDSIYSMLGIIGEKLFLFKGYSDELYYLSNNELTQLDMIKGKTDKDNIELLSWNNYLYQIDNNSFYKTTVSNDVMDMYIDDFIYVLTMEGNIIKFDNRFQKLVDILSWKNDIDKEKDDEQEKHIKIQNNKISFNDNLMRYDQNNEYNENTRGSFYGDDFDKNKPNFTDPYIIKNNKAYLQSDINNILKFIGEEVNEYDFSSSTIAYVRSSDNHLVVLDRKTKKVLSETDYKVNNIKVYDDKVYYNRHDNKFGFYYTYNGECTLINKIIASSYCVTDKNIYYNDVFLNNNWVTSKETLKKEKLNYKIDCMASEGDTLYFTERGQLLYKKIDNDNKKLINIIPKEWIDIFFIYDKHIYAGGTDVCYTEIFKFDKNYIKPSKVIYEDDKCIIFPVYLSGYEECYEAVFVYDKLNQIINDIVYYYYSSNRTEITKDAIYISDCAYDFPKIHRIDLKSLKTSVFHESEFRPDGLGCSLDFKIIGEDLIVIQNNYDFTTESSTGMTLISLSNPWMKRKIQSDKTLFWINNSIYYKDKESSLNYIDFNNGIDAKKIKVIDSFSNYITTYKNYAIFTNEKEIIKLNINDNTIQQLCNDFQSMIKTDNAIIYYENNDKNLVELNILSGENTVSYIIDNK